MIAEMVQPQQVRTVWEYVKTGLAKVQSKSPEWWIPEDIYADCVFQRSMLWLFKENDRALGFVVLQPKEDKTLHIWCAYANEPNHMKRAFIEIQNIAKQGNMEKITFDSWRKGWEKMAKELGFKPRAYVMEVSK